MGTAALEGGWGVLCTKPRSERIVVTNLTAQGFESYSPRCRGRGGRVEQLFPSYVFVKIVETWKALTGTRGVHQLMMWGEQPALLRPAEMERMRARQDDDGLIQMDLRRFDEGDQVRVESGPFKDFSAVYQYPDGSDRCLVLISMFGRTVRTRVAEADLSPA